MKNNRFRILDLTQPSTTPQHIASRADVVDLVREWARNEEWFVGWYVAEFGWPPPGQPQWLAKLKANAVRVLSWN